MGEKRIQRVRRNGQELALVSYEVVVPARGQLTKAEDEVARLVAKGMSNKQIAKARATKERTVANQLKAIFQKRLFDLPVAASSTVCRSRPVSARDFVRVGSFRLATRTCRSARW